MSASTARATLPSLRPTTIGGLCALLLSIATSVATVDTLGSSMQLRWTIGSFHQYGPETAPTAVVLGLFPALIVGLYIGVRWLRTYLERDDEFEAVTLLYELVAVAMFGAVLAVQLGLIALNLFV